MWRLLVLIVKFFIDEVFVVVDCDNLLRIVVISFDSSRLGLNIVNFFLFSRGVLLMVVKIRCESEYKDSFKVFLF